MTNAIPPEVLNSLPPSWEAYVGLVSAIFVVLAAAGRAWHAWKNDSGVTKALFFGTNSPSAATPPTPPKP